MYTPKRNEFLKTFEEDSAKLLDAGLGLRSALKRPTASLYATSVWSAEIFFFQSMLASFVGEIGDEDLPEENETDFLSQFKGKSHT